VVIKKNRVLISKYFIFKSLKSLLCNLDEYEEFNIDLIVKVLRSEKIQDICVIQLPEDINYADYMVIATCLSEKHLNSAFQVINRKYKNNKGDQGNNLKKSQGKENKWCAIDTGRIVVHLFLPEYREFYNLETLWSCGIENDESYLQFKEEKLKMEKRIDFLEVKE
jgi:ribosome-associated protein